MFCILLRRHLTLILMLGLAGCASAPVPQARDNWRSAQFSIPPKETLIVLLPPPLQQVKELQKGDSMMVAQLGKQLELAGFKVTLLNRDNYNEIWSKMSAEVGGIYDPVTGTRRPQAYGQAMSRLAQHVCKEAGCALLIQSRIVARTAVLQGSSATWDGQRTRIPTINDRGTREPNFTGSTSSFSIQLTAVMSTGAPAFLTYGGASIIHAMDMERPRGEVRRDLFNNDLEVAEGVRIALAPLIPARAP